MKMLLVCVAVASLILATSAGCPSPSAIGDYCARLYAHNYCQGFSRNVPKETQVSYLGANFNDQASSLVVAPGCKFTMYEHSNFSGTQRSFIGGEVLHNLASVRRSGWWTSGTNWNDAISSYKCTCGNVGGSGRSGIAKGKGSRAKGSKGKGKGSRR